MLRGRSKQVFSASTGCVLAARRRSFKPRDSDSHKQLPPTSGRQQTVLTKRYLADAEKNAKVAQPFLVSLLRRFIIAVLAKAFNRAHCFSEGAIISMRPPNTVGVDKDGGMDAAAGLADSESAEGAGQEGGAGQPEAGAGTFQGKTQVHHMDINPTSRAFLELVSTDANTLAAAQRQ